jgi:crotonobetainyl-CoA:carnitine CoA-transferase CaiB-like acyl-CoA transferase
MALGWSALYRLYPTADGWICIAVLTDVEWRALTAAVPSLSTDARFASAAARAEHDSALADVLGREFATRSASELHRHLSAAGVPCEVSSPDYMLEFFDDPANLKRGWLTTYEDPTAGAAMSFGVLAEFSETPGHFWGPPLVIGDHSREILAELGYESARIDQLCASGVVKDASDLR